MNLWSPEFFNDAELIAEIRQYAAARKQVSNGETAAFKSVAGEGRRIEFASTKDQRDALNADLREMMAEARRRGLPIGGTGGGAIMVETGV
jgi:hypothetical protein